MGCKLAACGQYSTQEMGFFCPTQCWVAQCFNQVKLLYAQYFKIWNFPQKYIFLTLLQLSEDLAALGPPDYL